MIKKFKGIKRLISGAVCAVMVLGTVLPGMTVQADETERRGNQNYISNQGVLVETPLVQLPLGAVKATEWLENQLLLQKTGLTGNMHKFDEYNAETSAWLGNSGEDWERGPYYLRGLMALAYVLDDETLKAEAQEWVEAILSSQKPNGQFGPGNTDWWPRMPIMMALRDYYEATGDGRILTFLENYFVYQANQLKVQSLSSWARNRGGDNIDSVLWYYNQVYDPSRPEDSTWLLALAELLYSQTQNWDHEYNETTVRQHVVNTSQGMKTPIVYYQYKKTDSLRNALAQGLLNMSIDHGRIDELPNSDEAARENRSTRGSETCGIVEGLLSTEIAMRVMGEVWIGDRIERMAYNSLPAAYTPDWTGHTYYILQNQVMATLGFHDFECDHGDSSAFGAPLGFDCCFSNCHMGWPKFVQNMWMGTADDGLAIVAYGPNQVTAKVADGKTAVFNQTTDYPFKDQIALDYQGEDAEFELLLRIPEWTVNPVVTVNGEVVEGLVAGEYLQVERQWKKGDKVSVILPSEIETSTWYNDSIAVEKGPLIYSLKIEEDWRTYDDNAARELKVDSLEGFPLREVYPASRWNYGLVVDEDNLASSFEIAYNDVELQPFSVENPPVTIKATGQILPEWELDGNIAGPQPYGPTAADESMQEEIELIPYGCGRLKITHFPKIGEQSETVIKTAEKDGKHIEFLGEEYLEFKNVIVPSAENYNLKVTGSGTGKVVINAKYEQSIDLSSGVAELVNLRNNYSGYSAFRFDNDKYNNIRFQGVDVTAIEVVPVNRTIEDIEITDVIRRSGSITIKTNLDPQETPYKIVYGFEEDDLKYTVTGSGSSTAVISNVEPRETYFVKIETRIKGEKVESEVMEIESVDSEDGLSPNPNSPNASYGGFPNSPEYITDVWNFYDPNGNISVQSGDGSTSLRFGRHSRVKAVMDADDNSYNWIDYVVEADINVDLVNNNNCGIMFRSRDISESPDGYKGYFAGIGRVNFNGNNNGVAYHGPGVMIGYADGNSWNDIVGLEWDIQPGVTYTVKVVAYYEMFAVYVNDELVTTFTDTRYDKGTVGLRSYEEAFTAEDFRVRPVMKEDLAVFEDDWEDPKLLYPEFEDAYFADDFSNVEQSKQDWRLIRPEYLNLDENGITFYGRTDRTGIKATAGDDNWVNYYYEADVTLNQSGGNGGLIFRTTNEGTGGDAFHGYYFGIKANGFEIGRADGGWYGQADAYYDIVVGETYKLSVMAYYNVLAFFINDRCVYIWKSTDNLNGKIGLRGHQCDFTAKDITVRPLTEEEMSRLESGELEIVDFDIEATSAYQSIQAIFPKVTTASEYKILAGTEPGVYTEEIVGIIANPYKTGSPFRGDKSAFTAIGESDYYVTLQAINGGQLVGQSNEVVIQTGYKENTDEERAALREIIAAAKLVNTSDFSKSSLARLTKAIADAEAHAADPNSTQMALGVAARVLELAMNKPDSIDFEDPATGQGADKTALEQLVADNCDRNPMDYPANLWSVYSDILQNAKDVIDDGNATQEEVDHAYNMLYLAAKLLDDSIGESVDKKEMLKIFIDAADAVTEEELNKVIPLVKKSFEIALEDAKDVYDKTDATDKEIEAAAKNLLEQLHRLGIVKGVKEYLEDLVDFCDGLDLDNYQDGADKDAFIDALKKAKDVLDDENAVDMEIEEAYWELYNAAQELTGRDFDKSELWELILIARDIKSRFDQYVEKGKSDLESMLAYGEEVYLDTGATEEQVRDAILKLGKAVAAMRYKANKQYLGKALTQAKAIDTAKYTEASVSVLLAAMDAAQEAMNDETLTKEEHQALVDKLTEELLAAIENLVEKTPSTGDQTDPTDDTDPTDSEEDTQKSTRQTDGKGPGGKNDGKNNVKTGDNASALVVQMLILNMAGAAMIMVFRRRKALKNDN